LLVPTGAWAQGEPLGPEFRVNTYTGGDERHPAVASDASGNFVVVWDKSFSFPIPLSVFGQRFDSSGAPLGPEFLVNTYTKNRQGFPAVASDASGNFVVVWDSNAQDGFSYGVFGQRHDSSGAPLGPEFLVNTFTMFQQRFPAVASESSGNFVVGWESYSQDGSNDGVFGQVFANSGAPLGPEFRVNTFTPGDQNSPSIARINPQFRVNTYTTDDQRFPAVASDASGNFFVVWESYSQDGSSSGIFGQRYNSTGAPLGPEFRVNTYTTSAQSRPAVASDSSGNFVVVWYSYQDGSTDIFGQLYDTSGAPLGPEFRVNTYTTDVQWFPAVASDASGNFVVVWESWGDQDGWGFGVFGQRYSQIVPVE
jgi:hypothetical protein